MKVIKTIKSMQKIARALLKEERGIYFVPTMGALHAGHLSLVARARQRAGAKGIVVSSVFVNPTQFAPNEDLQAYPRDLKKDAKMLKDYGTDYLFAPSEEEMYLGETQQITFCLKELGQCLCGISRPTHFLGVLQVVTKLLNIVQPTEIFVGQKDYQQAMIIKRLVQEYNFPVKVVVCPTVRERDGLAMSSRNLYMTKEQRDQAPYLRKALLEAQKKIREGERNIAKIKTLIRNFLRKNAPSGKIDYVEVRYAENLAEGKKIDRKVVIALAVKLGKSRLIDNILC